MDDKNLIRLSAVISVIGLIMIFFAAQFAEAKKTELDRVDASLTGQNVAVNGTISAKSIKDGNIFISITDGTYNLSVVFFEQNARNSDAYTLKAGDFVEVTGKVSIYRSSPEITASSIRLIK